MFRCGQGPGVVSVLSGAGVCTVILFLHALLMLENINVVAHPAAICINSVQGEGKQWELSEPLALERVPTLGVLFGGCLVLKIGFLH